MEMNCEYIKCPVCGKERLSEAKCPKCGFEYIPVDIENGTDIPIIMKAIQARKRWYNSLFFKFFVCVLGSVLVSSLISLIVANGVDGILYSKTSVFLTFCVILSIILSFLLVLTAFLNSDGDHNFKNERNSIVEKYLKVKAIQEEENRYQRQLELQKIELENQRLSAEKRKNDLVDKYGDIDKTIVLNNDKGYIDINNEIIVFGGSKHIFIEGVDYKFSDILNCELEDDITVTKGRSYATTQLSSGTRTMVALDTLAGRSDWATADAASGNKVTVTHKEPDIIKHQYKVHITTNNLSNPLITLYFLSNGKLARDVNSLITAVISLGKSAE